ncbi:hypothetical protein [Roseovarius sp. 217]|uniref:hypothetical protein n=1 Tax=Roseovarius sp. (strain 217) TaxID=314264 RepID=UPI0000685813|nr:hypothetical protein [Roseovarius sp. 217]EAQ27210.1 hypothetical protein ROS217_21827 [Roseovarius sp. 217]
MSDQDPAIERLYAEHGDDISRLAQDVQNAYSFSKVSFIYGRLKKLGPWKPEDFSMELIFEIDMMQAALAVEYSRVFVSGSRKVSNGKVPQHLKSVHEEIIQLRNKRYAHDGAHASVDNSVNILIEGERVTLKTGAEMAMCLGAPPEWEELIKWLGQFLFEQTEKQLKRLTEKTGLEWVQPMGPPPDWL